MRWLIMLHLQSAGSNLTLRLSVKGVCCRVWTIFLLAADDGSTRCYALIAKVARSCRGTHDRICGNLFGQASCSAPKTSTLKALSFIDDRKRDAIMRMIPRPPA